MSTCLESLLDSGRRAECRRHDEEMALATRTVTRAARMVTTSSGITIGIAHQPAPPQLSKDQEHIQSAFLEPRTAKPVTGWWRFLAPVWRAL